MNTRGRLKVGSALIAALVWPTLAHAQQAPAQPQVPAQANPQPSREEVTPPTPTTQPQAPTVSVDSRGALVQSSCPFETSPIRLSLTSVRFTRPDGAALQPQIAQTLMHLPTPTGDQPIKAVCDIRDAANAALRRDGWVASVQIPAQSIDGGELLLQVVTARITEIRVRGTPGPYRGALEARLQELRKLDPLNERDAERALLLAGDIPGLDVQLSLRPAGTQPGDVIGDLLITYRPFTIIANAQNFNSRALGRETLYARAEVYGLTGLQDVTYLGVSSTADFSEQQIVQAGETVGIGQSGLSLGPRIVYAWSKPDLGALDLKTTTLIAGFDITAPLKRSLNTNLRANAGVDYVDQRTTVQTTGAGATPLNIDKLRIVFARLSVDLTGRRQDGSIFATLRGGLEVRKGLGILNATRSGTASGSGAVPSRVDGNAQAFVARFDMDGQVGFARYFSLNGAVRAQYSHDPLLNYEEFSLGNLTIGRGYDPGANSGDKAVGTRAELAARIPFRTDFVVPQVFGFYDTVWLTNLDRNSTEVSRHLRSFGGGLRLVIANKLSLEAIYAHPQDRALTIDKAPPPDRVLISLTARFDARPR